MNRIVFPLEQTMQSPAVGNLQAALQELLRRDAVFSGDIDAQRKSATALSKEQTNQLYDGVTVEIVSRFQTERNLESHGAVDEPTAKALNALLEEWGLIDRPAAPTTGVVSGKVAREDGLPLQGMQVRATHAFDQRSIRLGEDVTDSEGRYTIRYQLLPGVDGIHLRVTVIDEEGKPLQSSAVVPNANLLEIVDLTIPIAEKTAAERRIEGVIVLEHGVPADKLKLRLYRHDFGGKATLLDETSTLTGGQYAFTYNAGDTDLSLEVRAVDESNQEIPLSKPLNELNREPRSVLNLLAPGKIQPPAAEYQRLSAALTPHVGQMTTLAEAKENDKQQDLTVLNRDTGWDARLIALAATTERLSADPEVTLPQEAVYGLLRAGLPSDKLLLAQVAPDVAEQALKTVRDAGIVALTDPQIAQFKTEFTAFSNTVRLNVPAPGSRSTYAALLESSGLPQDVQEKFVPIYLNHRGDAAQLWQAARNAGLDDTQVGKLQLQGKLAFLAGNSAAMTARLMKKNIGGKPIHDPLQLVEQDFHRADTWGVELFAEAGIPANRHNNLTEADEQKLSELIPAAYSGEKVEDRLSAYSEDMARKVRLSYPTQVVGKLLETDLKFKLPAAHDATVTLLKNAAQQGFRLGETPVTAFLKNHVGVTASMAGADVQSAQQQLQTLQRVYQITPSNEAMPVLISLGITSAHDVTAYSESAFMQLYTDKYTDSYGKPPPKDEPPLVYRKAKQVSSVAYNLFAIAKKMESDPPIAGMSAPVEVRESVRDRLIKQFPTMESLFGSMDYCECEHCRSVLSPAAYLVDLLQFIDPERKDINGNAMSPYDVLIERRPDLPHIPLTCENTHTALPYIDVVNEVLEYYVAHGKLEEEAAHDTGGATTAELLAEPQNVIRQAYDRLQEAHYPLNLPFDLWIETVRQFCNYFETPLARVLETFRPSDDLFAPVQPFDRASVFMELLGLTPAEVAIFIESNPLSKWHELYGFTDEATAITESTDAVTGQRIDLNSAKALSRRLGVTYKEITEIVQTGFVNPKLTQLHLLYKLGVSIHDVRFYLDHKGLLGQDPATLSIEDQQRQLEADAFLKALEKHAESFHVPLAQLETDLQAIPFAEILVLADPDAGCSFDLTTLQYADGTKAGPIAFLRINLFVRLWRRLGWNIEETDRALSTFIPQSAPFDADPAHLSRQPLKTALIYLAHLKALSEKLRVGKQSRLKLLALWSDMATTGKQSLYAQLFLTRSMLKSGEVEVTANGETGHRSVFDDPLGQYLMPDGLARIAEQVRHKARLSNVKDTDRIDPAAFAGEPSIRLQYDVLSEVQHLSYLGVLTDQEKARLAALAPSDELSSLLDAVQVKAQEFTHVKGHMLALQGALGLTADEIGHILADVDKSPDTAALSVPNVSLLYRYGLLAKALKLSVRELIALKQISGLNPFESLDSNPLATIEKDHPFSQTLRFVEIAEEVKESGLTIEDLDYLLRHYFDETGKYRPDRAGTLALLKTLAEGVRTIRAEHATPDDPGVLSEEVLVQKLGLVLPSEVVERFLAMMNRTAEFTATLAVASADQLHPTTFTGEPAISQLIYNEAKQEHRLIFRGVLFDEQKSELKARFNTMLNAGQQVAFAGLLDAVQAEAKQQADEFFVKHLEKQPLNPSVTTGFFEAANFDNLFAPLPEIKDNLTEDEKKAARNANEEQRKKKLTLLGKAFFPFLQQRLIRQFIVQTMTAQTGADPELVESLVNDERLLKGADAKSLLASFAAAGERGVSATFFDSDDLSGVPQAMAPVVHSADTAQKDRKDAAGNDLNPANSARFEGYLEVPTPGAYRFYIELDKQDAEAELRFDHLPDPVILKDTATVANAGKLDEFLELKPGIPYRFSLEMEKLGGGGARLLVQGETLPKDGIAQLTLYPLSAMAGAESAILLLSKALQLVQSLGLSEREIRYLLTHPADFDDLNLSELPTQSVGNTPAEQQAATDRFTRVLRLAAYTRLKRDLAGGTDDLIEIFEAAGAGDLDRVYLLIARLTRRDEATVKAVARALFIRDPSSSSFTNEKPLQRLWEALQVVERFGVPVASLLAWTQIVSPRVTPEQRFEIARDLKEAIKARFEPETWQRVAQPIFDKLRQRQRDALAAHVMHQHGFDRMEQLYEHFLLDPGMEPVVQTSRIRLAISSLQLFIQRCLLNLELKVRPSAINSRHWEWMKRYRVWEANRKIFLFPENWLEPEFRDDKTHLFAELEGALLQGDVSSDLVEDAFLSYLKKMDQLARLDIVAMHIEDDPDPERRTLHVFGRTFGQPHTYFYRRYARQMWTPWEPVSAEIEGDHLAPVVWRDRLYLFWVTFMDKPDENGQPGSSSGKTLAGANLLNLINDVRAAGARKKIEVQLHWSEYLQGEWSTRQSSEFFPIFNAVDDYTLGFTLATVWLNSDPRKVFIHVSKEPIENNEERGVFIHLGSNEIRQAFYFASRNSVPESKSYSANDPHGLKPERIYSASDPRANRYSGNDEFKVRFQELITTEPEETPPKANPSILKPDGAYMLSPCNNNLTALGISKEALQDAANPDAVKAAIESGLGEIASLIKPVFYQDNRHTLFVEPNVTERTIEETREWVTHTPQPDQDWWRSVGLRKLTVKAAKPGKGLRTAPRSLALHFLINPESLINPKPERDWLVNEGTVLAFDGVLIGPTGQPGLQIQTNEATGFVAVKGMQVNVNPGSGLASGSAVVLADAMTFEQSGLVHAAGGLNVVGNAGFNAALAQSLTGSSQVTG